MKTITLPLIDFLEITWKLGCRECYTPSLDSKQFKHITWKELVEAIKKGDPDEELCHIEDASGYVSIWRKKEWLTCDARDKQKKLESEARVAAFDKYKLALEKIKDGICNGPMGFDRGEQTEEDLLQVLALKFYRERNLSKLKVLCGIETLEELGIEPEE